VLISLIAMPCSSILFQTGPGFPLEVVAVISLLWGVLPAEVWEDVVAIVLPPYFI
jgi:hypothetical protein